MFRRMILIGLAALVAWTPVCADDSIFRLRAGLFAPDGDSAFWKEDAEHFDGSADDLEDTIYGLDWNYSLSRGMGFLFAGTVFSGETDESTLEAAPFSGEQRKELRLTSLSILFTFMGPEEWRFRPWVGVGAGIHKWSLELEGDVLVDAEEVTNGKFKEDDLAVGLSVAAGLDFWIQDNWGLSLDYRQHWAEDDPSNQLEDRGSIDLGGREIALGFVWKF